MIEEKEKLKKFNQESFKNMAQMLIKNSQKDM